MADEIATPAEPAAAPATPAPAEPATPSAESPLDDRRALNRLADAAPAETPAEPAGDEPAAPEVAAIEAPGETKTDAQANKVEQALSEAETPEDFETLKKLAERHGFVIDGNKVVNRERADFRDYQRKQRERLAQEKEAAIAEINQTRAAADADLKRAEAISAAIASGDGDTLAQLGGFKDWNDMQQAYINKHLDPNFKEIQELKKSLKEKEEREAAQRQEYQRQVQMQQAAERKQRYIGRLSQQMSQSKDPLIQHLSDDPQFVSAIYEIQKKHWDDSTQTTVSPERAAQISGLTTQVRAQFERLQKVYGNGATATVTTAPPAAPSPAAPPAAPAKKANKTQVVKGPAVEPASNGEFDEKKFWSDYAIKKMKEAADGGPATG